MNFHLPMDAKEIANVLPHRAPFLLLDRVTDISSDGSIRGEKDVKSEEPWFQGHFPGNPIFPGVLILETMAQLAGVLAAVSNDPAPLGNGRTLLLSVDNAKFRRVVVPGETLSIHAKILQRRERAMRVRAEARVGENVVAEAELLLMRDASEAGGG